VEALQEPAEEQIEIGPAEQAGIFLVEDYPDNLLEYSRHRLFDERGKLVFDAIRDIQQVVTKLKQNKAWEVVQRYEGYVRFSDQVPETDATGQPTGELKWTQVQAVGPEGIECIVYIREK
jgi:hypothetical protein